MQILPLTLLAATLTLAEAFAPAALITGSRTSRAAGALQMASETSEKPLTELCEITKEACEAVAPMLNELYSQIKIYRNLRYGGFQE